ncbi:MAG: YdcF family protein [Gammaproteobacteria bacterium]|nr:YdcF family protein [Gammaproteobacteria bacterium]
MVEVAPKIEALLLIPPGIIIVVALLGFLIQIRWMLVGSLIVVLSVAALLVLSLPLTGYQFIHDLESRFPPLKIGASQEAPAPGAIVVLGAGRYTDAVEFGEGDSVSSAALERLRYAVYLHRATHLPILISGGSPYGENVSEAELMKISLTRDFQVEPKWVENKSATTFENAKFSKAILSEAGIKRVYLVTHASHMPRAVWAFENAGVNTIPAPMGFTTLNKEDRQTLGYFPSAYGLQLSSRAWRERLGLFWYQRKYAAPAAVEEKTPAAVH